MNHQNAVLMQVRSFHKMSKMPFNYIFLKLVPFIAATVLFTMPTLGQAGSWVSIDQASDTGVYIGDDGRRYEGSYGEGHGGGRTAVIIYRSGTRYEGETLGFIPHGKGIMIWTKGSRYEGDFVTGRRAGKGVYIFANGDRYEGDFVNGQRTGKGIYIFVDGNRYEGDFVDGLRTGKGVYIYANGNRYEGDFVDNHLTGKGVYIFPNGDRYEGDFVNGNWTGKGVLSFANGDRYEGDFVDDNRTGKGVFIFANGDRYEGDWVKGTRTGKGIYTYPSGIRYEGDFVNGNWTGKGILVFPNGDRYEGDFVGQKKQGYGIYSYHNGTRTAGYWEQDRFVRAAENTSNQQQADGQTAECPSNPKLQKLVKFNGLCWTTLYGGNAKTQGYDVDHWCDSQANAYSLKSFRLPTKEELLAIISARKLSVVNQPSKNGIWSSTKEHFTFDDGTGGPRPVRCTIEGVCDNGPYEDGQSGSDGQLIKADVVCVYELKEKNPLVQANTTNGEVKSDKKPTTASTQALVLTRQSTKGGDGAAKTKNSTKHNRKTDEKHNTGADQEISLGANHSSDYVFTEWFDVYSSHVDNHHVGNGEARACEKGKIRISRDEGLARDNRTTYKIKSIGACQCAIDKTASYKEREVWECHTEYVREVHTYFNNPERVRVGKQKRPFSDADDRIPGSAIPATDP